MNEIASQFKIRGKAMSAQPFGCGHINGTFLVSTDAGIEYILQRINTFAFKDPEGLMENIFSVTNYLAKDNPNRRECMHMIPTRNRKTFYVDADGQYWRMYEFVTSSICLQKVETPMDLYYTGRAFGEFQCKLADYPADTLNETIKDFHNTKVRFEQLHEAMKGADSKRLEACKTELDFFLTRENEAGQIVDRLADGSLPLRVTHNDTKLNNILFDHDTRKPLCVIDLDTIMPGSALYDYGDGIRFGASTADEDEHDLDKVFCDMELFKTYTEGFLDGCGKNLTKLEIDMMPIGAKLMTLECGTRFITDFLNGDVYFKTSYENQNLYRARTQMKLVMDMEDKWEQMCNIVKELRNK